MSNPTEKIIETFKDELENIGKLAETPNLMREVALKGIESALKHNPNPLVQKSLENTKQVLENITDSSIKENYKIIYTQMGILAVSSLEAALKKYFHSQVSILTEINKDNKKLLEIKVTAMDLINHDFTYKEYFGDLLLEKETNSFQNLKLIKQTFESYLGKQINLNDEDEKKLIFYLEIRHILVHKSGTIDDRFVNATEKMNANLRGYKIGDKVELDEEDWTEIKKNFIILVESIMQ